jgi:hypothetical protein
MKRGKCLVSEVVRINNQDGDIEIDADALAEGLKTDVTKLRSGLRTGSITSRCERGVGEDEGRFRLTFFSDQIQFRLIVDKGGTVLQSSIINFGDKVSREISRFTQNVQLKPRL